jgi:hypothetical protein
MFVDRTGLFYPTCGISPAPPRADDRLPPLYGWCVLLNWYVSNNFSMEAEEPLDLRVEKIGERGG